MDGISHLATNPFCEVEQMLRREVERGMTLGHAGRAIDALLAATKAPQWLLRSQELMLRGKLLAERRGIPAEEIGAVLEETKRAQAALLRQQKSLAAVEIQDFESAFEALLRLADRMEECEAEPRPAVADSYAETSSPPEKPGSASDKIVPKLLAWRAEGNDPQQHSIREIANAIQITPGGTLVAALDELRWETKGGKRGRGRTAKQSLAPLCDAMSPDNPAADPAKQVEARERLVREIDEIIRGSDCAYTQHKWSRQTSDQRALLSKRWASQAADEGKRGQEARSLIEALALGWGGQNSPD